MGIFSFFKSAPKEKSFVEVGDLESLLRSQMGSVESGVIVNTRTASQVSTVLACATLISNGISQIPFKMYKKEKNYNVYATEHPLYKLFEYGPNPYQSGFDFRNNIGLHLALCGEAFIWLNRIGGKIYEMFLFNPQDVNVLKNPDGDGWESIYQVTFPNGITITVPSSDMWHLKWRAFDRVRGLSPVVLARRTIGLALSSESHLSSTMRSGAKPSGILTSTTKLDEQQRTDLRDSWIKNYTGADNAGKVVLLPDTITYQPYPSTSNTDTQFVENREFQVTELCRFWNVVPMMIGQYQNSSTYASTEQLSIQHVVHTLGPWFANIESSAEKFLLTEEERVAGYYFGFIDSGLLRGDAKARSELYRTMVNNGIYTINEVREKEDLKPVPDGDVPLVQGAMIPLNLLGANYGVSPDGIPSDKKPKTGKNPDDSDSDTDTEPDKGEDDDGNS